MPLGLVAAFDFTSIYLVRLQAFVLSQCMTLIEASYLMSKDYFFCIHSCAFLTLLLSSVSTE